MEGYPGQMEHVDSINLPTRFKLLPAVTWPDNSRKQGTWTAALPPLCRNSTGLCPCDYFGRTLCDSLPSSIKIGIINVAVAGCAIECFDKDKYQAYLALSSTAQWLRDIATLYGGNPYGRLVEMGKAAQKDGVIKGFLLHQGESGTGISGDNWGSEVKKIYSDLIKDLSLDSNKTPLLAGETVGGGTNDVNNLPKTMKNAYVINSVGCAANSSGIHFDGPGYRLLGTRYADTMLKVFKRLGTLPTPTKVIGNNNAAKSGDIGFLTVGASTASFKIPQRAFVTLTAFTLAGKEIAQLARAEYSAGKHSIEIGRKEMPAGVFVLRLKAGAFSATRTIMASGR
jgi:hypothetical protein